MLDEILKKGCPYYTKCYQIKDGICDENGLEVWVNYCEFRNEKIRCAGRMKKKDDVYGCTYFIHWFGSSNIVEYLQIIYDGIREIRTG